MMNAEKIMEAWTRFDSVAHGLVSPVTSNEQYEQALEVIESLMTKVGENADHPAASLLDLLVDRVHNYEAEHYALPTSSPERILAYLISERGVTQKELESATGIDQSNLSKLLKGARKFNIDHVKSLSEYFHVSPAVFIA